MRRDDRAGRGPSPPPERPPPVWPPAAPSARRAKPSGPPYVEDALPSIFRVGVQCLFREGEPIEEGDDFVTPQRQVRDSIVVADLAVVLAGFPLVLRERSEEDEHHTLSERLHRVPEDQSPAVVVFEDVPHEDAVHVRAIGLQVGDRVDEAALTTVDTDVLARLDEPLRIGGATAPVLDCPMAVEIGHSLAIRLLGIIGEWLGLAVIPAPHHRISLIRRRLPDLRGDDRLIIRVVELELFLGQLRVCEPEQEGRRDQHIAARPNVDMRGWKHFANKTARGLRRESPVPGGAPLIIADLAQSREGRQHDAAWLQHPVDFRQCRTNVVNEVQCLRNYHAVERIRRHVRHIRQIAHDRRSGSLVGVENIASRNVRAPESARVCALPDFQNASADQPGIALQESFDEIPVDRTSAIVSIRAAHRRQASQIAEIDLAARRCERRFALPLDPPQSRRREDGLDRWLQPLERQAAVRIPFPAECRLRVGRCHGVQSGAFL